MKYFIFFILLIPINLFAYDSTNVLYQKTCTDTIHTGTDDCSKALDADLINTYWSSGAGAGYPQSMTVYVPTGFITGQITLHPYHDSNGGRFKDFSIYGSENGTDWSSAIYSGTVANSNTSQEFNIDDTERYFYIKITNTSSYYTDNYTILRNFELNCPDSGCGEDEPPPVNMGTTTAATLNDVAFGIAIMITLMMLGYVGYIFNKISTKKPWK